MSGGFLERVGGEALEWGLMRENVEGSRGAEVDQKECGEDVDELLRTRAEE